jgi:Polyketide cyclase / dehydrase and lipid transport
MKELYIVKEVHEVTSSHFSDGDASLIAERVWVERARYEAMSAWELQHSAVSGAGPAQVWERYTDVDEWREWSKGVEKSSLDGPFKAGTKGTSKPPNMPKGRFQLVAVEPEQGFTSEIKLPGGTLTLEHMLEPTDGGTRITHRATLAGPLNFIWTPVIGRMIKRELPDGVERLAELAVEKEEEARREAKEEEERNARLRKADEEFKEEIARTAPKDGRDPGAPSLPGSAS